LTPPGTEASRQTDCLTAIHFDRFVIHPVDPLGLKNDNAIYLTVTAEERQPLKDFLTGLRTGPF
jgi:hypothetical protein